MTKEIFQEIKGFIKEIGFPIGVAIWLLWEAHTTIARLTYTLEQLNGTLYRVGVKIDNPNPSR